MSLFDDDYAFERIDAEMDRDELDALIGDDEAAGREGDDWEPPYCRVCDGTGEGRASDTRCGYCRGTGYERRRMEVEP